VRGKKVGGPLVEDTSSTQKPVLKEETRRPDRTIGQRAYQSICGTFLRERREKRGACIKRSRRAISKKEN